MLAFQRVGQGLQRTVVGATQNASAASVVEQGVHGFLQHALFIAHDDFGSVQVHQLLQPVVAVDDAAIQIVKIGSGEASAIQWNQRTKLRWNDRNYIENHPMRLVGALAERLNYFEPLGVLEPLLQRVLMIHLLAQFGSETFDVNALEKFFNRFRAHHCLEAGGAELLVEFAILGFVLDNFVIFDWRFARLDHDISFEIKYGLEIAQRDIEKMADTAGQSLKEPHVRAGRCQFDVAQALAANFG